MRCASVLPVKWQWSLTFSSSGLNFLPQMEQLDANLNSNFCSFVKSSIGLFIEGSLEVKLPTIWTVEKQR